jgi:hypothetical protein
MTVAQRDSLNVPLTDFKEHPSATTLLDLGSNSPLWPMRNATKSVLMSEDKLVRGLYAVINVYWKFETKSKLIYVFRRDCMALGLLRALR